MGVGERGPSLAPTPFTRLSIAPRVAPNLGDGGLPPVPVSPKPAHRDAPMPPLRGYLPHEADSPRTAAIDRVLEPPEPMPGRSPRRGSNRVAPEPPPAQRSRSSWTRGRSQRSVVPVDATLPLRMPPPPQERDVVIPTCADNLMREAGGHPEESRAASERKATVYAADFGLGEVSKRRQTTVPWVAEDGSYGIPRDDRPSSSRPDGARRGGRPSSAGVAKYAGFGGGGGAAYSDDAGGMPDDGLVHRCLRRHTGQPEPSTQPRGHSPPPESPRMRPSSAPRRRPSLSEETFGDDATDLEVAEARGQLGANPHLVGLARSERALEKVRGGLAAADAIEEVPWEEDLTPLSRKRKKKKRDPDNERLAVDDYYTERDGD